MSRIFISYSRDDKAITEKLAPLLRKVYSSENVWYDAELRGGEEWWKEILEQVAECEHFIFLMSNESLKSNYCLGELEEARRLGKHIIPVKVRRSAVIPDAHSYLNGRQIIDMVGDVTMEGLNNIYASLKGWESDNENNVKNYQKRYETDKKLLERLWPLINSSYIDLLDEQTQYRRINVKLFEEHIIAYGKLRNAPENVFFDPSLERAFRTFEKVVNRFIETMSYTYILEDIRGESMLIMPRPGSADKETYDALSVQYNKVVDSVLEVVKQHRKLVKSIRVAIPEFDFR
jgi:hypothetical protein